VPARPLRAARISPNKPVYDAVTQYQRALAIQPNRPLANFRMGEAFFYQKNYQAQPTPSAKHCKPSPNRQKSGRKFGVTSIWVKFLTCWAARARRQRIQQSKTNQRRHRRRPASRGRIPEKAYSEGGASVAAPPAGQTPKPALAIPPPASGEKARSEKAQPFSTIGNRYVAVSDTHKN